MRRFPEFVRSLFSSRRASAPPGAGRTPESFDSGTERRDRSWFFPPDTVEDPAAWDRYWQEQITHRAVGFIDMFCEDGGLIDVMRANGLRTVLCVGNGLSQEPRALAWAGFDVTALDLSPFASHANAQAAPPEEMLARLAGREARSGGGLAFVTGDLRDASRCPGPYDVVIERNTLQLFPEEHRPAAIRAVVDRLAPRAVFFSQCHDGRWRPGSPREHPIEPWLRAEGWPFLEPGQRLTGRHAALMITTG